MCIGVCCNGVLMYGFRVSGPKLFVTLACGRSGFRCFQHLNPVDPLHNCMFDNNKLSLQNVFAKNYFAMFRKAPEVGNIICIFL